VASTQVPVTELDVRYPTLIARAVTGDSLGAELHAAGLTGGQVDVILDRTAEGGSHG
jgi:hypothetical protein